MTNKLSKEHIKLTSPIVIKVFFILFFFNLAGDILSSYVRENKIMVIKEYYSFSLKDLVDKNKVDLFVKATSDFANEIKRIDKFILEGNILTQIIGIIEFIIETVLLYIFSFYLTKFYVRNK